MSRPHPLLLPFGTAIVPAFAAVALVTLTASGCGGGAVTAAPLPEGPVVHLVDVVPARVGGTAVELPNAYLREEREVPLAHVGKLAIGELQGLPIDATVTARDALGQPLRRRATARDLFKEEGFTYVPARQRFPLGGTREVAFLSFYGDLELRVAARHVGLGSGTVRLQLDGRPAGTLAPSTDGDVSTTRLKAPFGVHTLAFETDDDDAVELVWAELVHDGPPLVVTNGEHERLNVSYRDASVADGFHPATIAQGNAPISRLHVDEPEEGLGFGVRRRCSIGGDRRVAYWMPGTTTLETPAEVRPGARLRFALGVPETVGVGPWAAWEPAPVSYRVSWLQGARETVLFEERLVASGAWNEREVFLPDDLEGRGVLRFSTTTSGTEPAAFADPRLVQEAERAQAGPNVLLYVVDTLRMDHLSCYGGRNHTSPRLDGLARQGFRFESAYAVAPATRSAMATLLTGFYPNWHGVGAGRPLPGSLHTLAESMAAGGYTTWAAVASDELSDPDWGFDQGFHRFVDRDAVARVRADEELASSTRLNELVVPWLDQVRDEPFLLYVHATDTMAPHRVPAEATPRFSVGFRGAIANQELHPKMLEELGERPSQAAIDYVRNVYDDEIRLLDQRFGELLDAFSGAGLLENTIVVVVSDHGEQLFEHGAWGHGKGMWEELVRIPWIVWVPRELRVERNLSPRAVSDGVSQVDFLPGLLDLVDVDDPFPRQGRSWRGLLRGRDARIRPWVGLDDSSPRGLEVGAYRSSRFKMIWTRSDSFAREWVIDLRRDPGEKRNLSDLNEDMLERLRLERDALLTTIQRVEEELVEAGYGHVKPAPRGRAKP